MKNSKRLIFYLFLNVVVSACATLTVLLVWDQMNGSMPKGVLSGVFERFSSEQVPTLTPAPKGTAALAPTATKKVIIHQVIVGDTFDSIALQYGVTVGEILAANGFTRVQPLGTGEILRIPAYPESGVSIESVVGPGDLETERVLLKHRGAGELSLVGWRLEDGSGQLFVFRQCPQLTLFGGGGVNVHTRAGVDTVVDLFWGLDHPVWYSGATVLLRDAQGNVRDTYVVP